MVEKVCKGGLSPPKKALVELLLFDYSPNFVLGLVTPVRLLPLKSANSSPFPQKSYLLPPPSPLTNFLSHLKYLSLSPPHKRSVTITTSKFALFSTHLQVSFPLPPTPLIFFWKKEDAGKLSGQAPPQKDVRFFRFQLPLFWFSFRDVFCPSPSSESPRRRAAY